MAIESREEEGSSHFHKVEVEETEWDSFLQDSTLGQYPQSSTWARYKQATGWNCFRHVIRRDGMIRGGFQLLWKKTPIGRIGYVRKGPVAKDEDPRLVDDLVSDLTKSGRRLRLLAIVVQPPNCGWFTASRLQPPLFLPNRVLEIITATLLIDVTGGAPVIEARMRKTTRKYLRRAVRGGVCVREGTENDLDLFFALMVETCKRQGVAPNPSDPAALKALWETEGTGVRCRLTFAEHGGKAIAGLFCIGFGDTLTLWKKGSLPEYLPKRPVELLYHESLVWAQSSGYRFCDFGSMSRHIAERLLAGKKLTEEEKGSRDWFNLGFGDTPLLMPQAFFHFPNHALSFGYRLLTSNHLALKLFGPWARRLGTG